MTISVEVPASLTLEISREALLSLTDPTTGAQIDPDNFQAAVTIVDTSSAMSEGVVTFNLSSDAPAIVQEGADQEILTITYTVTRSDSTGALDLGYSLVPTGAALLDSTDFQGSTSGTLHFDDGADTAQFNIQISGDNQVGPDESFRIDLGDDTNPLPAGAQVFGSTNGTIANDDAYISVASAPIADAGSGEVTHSFVITRSGATDGEHTSTYTIQAIGEQGSTELDSLIVNELSGSLTFAAGETSKTVTIDLADNPVIAGYQTFGITLEAAGDSNVTILNNTAISTLNPNLQDITVTPVIDRALEGTAEGTAVEFLYTVTRSGNTTDDATLTWSLAGSGESAATADDFPDGVFPSGTITFTEGATTAEIRFTANEDAELDGEEGFVLNLSSDVPAVRVLDTATPGYIVDDESAVGFNTATTFSVVEGDDGASNLLVTVTRIGFSGETSTVDWRVALNDTDTATMADILADQDLLGDNGGLPSGTLTLLPGETSGSILIEITGDVDYEDGLDETLSVVLANPSEGTKLIGEDVTLSGYAKTTTATITNDDSLISVVAATVEYIEGDGGETQFMEITLTRTGSTAGEDWVSWNLSTTDPYVDNTDLGEESNVMAAFNAYSDSWIELSSLSGTESVSAEIDLPKSGYIMVAYNRDMAYQAYLDAMDGHDYQGSVTMPFDEFLLNNLSAGGGTLTALGTVSDGTFVADDAVVGEDGVLFSSTDGLELPDGGRQVVITGGEEMTGIYFEVTGLYDTGEGYAERTEIVQALGGGSVSTEGTFVSVTSVEVVDTGISVGWQPSGDVRELVHDPVDFYSQLALTLNGGELVSEVSTSYDNSLGYVTINSEANLTGTSFQVTGGIAVATFDATDSISQNIIETGPTWQQAEIGTAAQIVVEQTIEGTDPTETYYFLITGLDTNGDRVSELVVVGGTDQETATSSTSFSVVQGIAPVDGGGNALTDNLIPADSGRFEFYVPKTFTIEGGAEGSAMGDELVNYVESIVAVRDLPETLTVDIGIAGESIETDSVDNMLIAADGTSVSLDLGTDSGADNLDDNTGNPVENGDATLAYAIFKVDATEDSITLTYNAEQLGRMGIDTSSISYAPDGTWSENVDDMAENGDNLLIPALTATAVTAGENDYRVITIDDLLIPMNTEEIDAYQNSIGGIYIYNNPDTDNLEINTGSAETPVWVSYADYYALYDLESEGYGEVYDPEGGNGSTYYYGVFINAEEIESGNLRFNGSASTFYADYFFKWCPEAEAYDESSYGMQVSIENKLDPEAATATGSVAISESGYIWLRYANTDDSGNDGADQAFINSLYVGDGATLSVVGQKLISDGLASVDLTDAGSLELSGAAVESPGITVSPGDGNTLIALFQTTDDAPYLYNGTYSLVGTNSSGETVVIDDMWKANSQLVGTDALEGGTSQAVILSTDSLVSVESLRINEYDYYSDDWDQGYPLELYDTSVSLVMGDLDSLAAHAEVTPLSLGSYDNYIELYNTSFQQDVPGAPLNAIDYSVSVTSSQTESLGSGVEEKSMDFTVTNPGTLSFYSYYTAAGSTLEISGLDLNGDPVSETLTITTSYSQYVYSSNSYSELTSVEWSSDTATTRSYAEIRLYNQPNPPGGSIDYEILDQNVALTGLSGQELLSATESLTGDSRVVLSSISDLEGMSVQVTGTLADGTTDYSETITFGEYTDNACLAYTDSLFSSVDSIEVVSEGYTGYLNIVDSMVFDEPVAALAFQYARGDSSVSDMVITGLDANGELLRVAVDSDMITAGTKYPLGEFTEIFDMQLTSPRYDESIYVMFGAADGSTDGTTDESLYNAYLDIPLNTAAAGEDGLVHLEEAERIIISSEHSDTQHYTYRVIGWTEDMDPTADDPIIETFVGIENNSYAVTEQYFTTIQAVQVTGVLPNEFSNPDEAITNIYVGTIGEPIVEEEVSRYGTELQLGEPVAEFDTASKLVFTSEDDLSDREFTITGTLADGTTVTETVTGLSDGRVFSEHAYMTITDISVDEGAGGAVKIGYLTTSGGMTDDFVITGSGTADDPFVGYSTNTLENFYQYDNEDAQAQDSEADVLLYVNLNGAESTELHYDLTVQGSPGEDVLYVEYSSDILTLLEGTATFVDGESETTILIPIAGDDAREGDESMSLSLTDSSEGTTIVDGEDTTDITIINDDDVVTLETISTSGSEGNDSNGIIEFTISRLDAGPAKTVAWEIGGLVDEEGNPIAGAAGSDDFAATTGTATFAEGETTATIQVEIAADRTYEGDETFQLVLSDPVSGSGYSLSGNTSANSVIVNDDVQVTVTADATSVAEGDAGTVTHTFTITRTGDLSQASVIDWNVTGSNAEGAALAATGVDFADGSLPTGTLSFAAGETGSQNSETQTITITTNGDETWLGDRGFTLTLANGDQDTSDITTATALGLINEDDSGGIIFETTAITEGTGETATNQTLTLTRTGDTSRALTLDWEVLSEGGDVPVYADDFDGGVLPSGQVSFAAGSATTTISFDVVADALVEPDETMTIRLSSPYADTAFQDQLVTLLGDDIGFGVQVSTTETAEGTSDGAEVTLTFIRMGDTSAAADYTYEFSGVTDGSLVAVDGTDFGGSLPSGTVSFGIGETSVTQVISVSADSLYESDEGFKVTLLDGTTTLAESDVVTITNDDAGISIAVDTGSFTEGSVVDGYEELTYTLTRQGNLGQESTVEWAVTEGSIAVADLYGAYDQDGNAIDLSLGLPTGTVTFAEDETEQTIILQVNRDSLYEGDETVTLELSNPSTGTSITVAQAQTTVVDDDAQVQFEASSLTISGLEGTTTATDVMSDSTYSTLTFTVERSGDTTGTSTVDWELVYDGSANAADFTGTTSGTVSFAADETSKEISVQVLADRYGEVDETFSVLLSNPGSGTSIGTEDTATGTIEGDDVGIYLAETQAIVVKQGEGLAEVDAEGNVTATTVTTFSWDLVRVGDLSQEVTISYSVGARNMDGSYVYDYTLADYGSGWYYSVPDVEAEDFDGGSFLTGTVTFSAGVSTATLSVDVVGDNVVEYSEAFKIALSRPDGIVDFNINTSNPLATEADTQYLTGIIARDEGLVTLSSEIASSEDTTAIYAGNAKAEGDDEATTHYFKIIRELSSSGDLTVDWQVSGSYPYGQIDVDDFLSHSLTTAADVDDFVFGQDLLGTNDGLPSGTVTILDGETEAIIAIQVSGDLTSEDIESFRILLGDLPSGYSYTSTGSYSYGYIGADDAVFSVGMLIADTGDASEYGSKAVAEGESVTYRIYRSGDTSGEASVDWTVTYPDMVTGDEASSYGYIADAGDFADGQVLNGTVTFADGEEYQEITLTAKADTITESWAEGFAITLSNPVNGGISQTTGTMESLIIDQDAPASLVSVAAVVTNDGVEGTTDGVTGTTITYTLTRTGDTTSAGQIGWTLDTNGSTSDVGSITGDTGADNSWGDYWSGLVSFDAGETTKTIVVNVNPDTTVESDEDFVFTLVDAPSILDSTGTNYDTGWWNYGTDGDADLGIDTGIVFADSAWFGGEIPDSGSMLRDPDAYQITTSIENDDVRIRINHVNLADALDAEVFEGDSGTTDFNLSLSRYGELEGDITLGYEVVIDGQTADGSDVVVATGTLTLEAGESSYTKVLSIITADYTPEADESFILRLSSADVNVKFGQYTDSTGTAGVDLPVTILNDDTEWSVTSSALSQAEGDSGETAYVFTISRPDDGTSYDGTATVAWEITHGDTDAADFSGDLSGTVTFAENEFTKDIIVNVVGDDIGELDEAFTFSLTDVDHGVINTSAESVTATIVNEDQSISIGDAEIVEGNSGTPQLVFTVTRTGDLTATATADWDVVHDQGEGTTNAADFVEGASLSGTVTFDAVAETTSGTQSVNITLDINPDSDVEADETFNVNLSNLSSGLTGLDTEALGTVVNDDAQFTITAGEQAEEGDDQTFTITRSNATVQDQTVNWTVSSDGSSHSTDSDDFSESVFPSGSVTFTGDELEKTITLAATEDALAELDEAFIVTLTPGDGVTAAMIDSAVGVAYGTVLNDDGEVDPSTITPDSQVSLVSTASGLEGHTGEQYVTFTLTRSGVLTYDVSVDWQVQATTNESDNADADDFGGSLPSGTLTLAAGQSSIELQVPISGDSITEGDETFTLALLNPGAGLEITSGDETATGTIINDDAVITIDGDVVVNEDDGTATFTLARSGVTDGESSVDWSIATRDVNGTDDLTGDLSGTVTFAGETTEGAGDGETSKTITINIDADTVSESDEVFDLSLTNVSDGTSVGVGSATLTLTNDDIDNISFTVDAIEKVEGDGTGTVDFLVTVSRENPTTTASVDWVVAGSGDHPEEDIVTVSGNANFNPGDLTQTFTVSVNSDDIGAFDETFSLSLSNPLTDDAMGAQVTTDPTALTVLNDDPAISVALSAESFTEGNGTESGIISFVVIREGDTSGTASVDWEVQAGDTDPVNIADFGGYWPSGTTVFSDGESEKLIQIAIAPDANYEVAENFKVVLSNLVADDAGARIIVDTDSAAITNDDNGVSVTANQVSVSEGGAADDSGTTSATFTITGMGIVGEIVDVDYIIEGTGTNPANSDDFASGYGAGSVSITIGEDGTGSTTVTTLVQKDQTFGTDEEVSLRITDVTNATVDVGQASYTIINDDSMVSVSPTVISYAEGAGGTTVDYTFTVTRTGDLTRASSIYYILEELGDNPADISGATDFDFTTGDAASGWLEFAAVEDPSTTDQNVTVTIKVTGDDVFESDESFAFVLQDDWDSTHTIISEIDPAGARVLSTIVNDDLADLIVTRINAEINEGSDEENPNVLTYLITRNGDCSQALTINYTINEDPDHPGTLPQETDLTNGLSGSVVMAAGESGTILSLEVAPDMVPESDMYFIVQVSADGFDDPDAVSGSIFDDDTGISTVYATSVDHGDYTEYQFTVIRTGDTNGVVNVSWEASGIGINPVDDADFASDFVEGTLTSGTITLDDGTAQTTCSVYLTNDSFVENNETLRFTLTENLTSPDDLPILTADADVTIESTITPTDGDDLIYGGLGPDTIEALAGNDTIHAGDGTDVIYGGDGNDIIHAGQGADIVYGGDGDDVIYADGGTDAVYAGGGNDEIVLNSDNVDGFDESLQTFVDGGLGTDTLTLDGSGMELDFTTAAQDGAVRNIDIIDMSGDGANRLVADVSALAAQDKEDTFDTGLADEDIHQLMVEGDDDDTLEISDLNDWALVQEGESDFTYTYNGSDYHVYNHADGAEQLIVNVDIIIVEETLG